MDIIKRIFLVAVGLISCSSSVLADEYTFASLANHPEQTISGKIMTEIYGQLGYAIEVTPLPGLRAQSAANSGKVAGEVARIWEYGDQTPNVIRVPTAYYSLKTVGYALSNSGIKVNNKEELSQYKVVIIRGVKHTAGITRDMKKSSIEIVDSPESMMQSVSNGQAQIALTNPLLGSILVKQLGENKMELVGPSLAQLGLYHYIHKDHAELVPIINQKIIELRNSGELDNMIAKYEADVLSNWPK
ncbi:substrate-binding periplasmic protein [Vibrio pectenicida]|uniref:Transporter substrate-binding domain-containing protein n=1 Tax=Vibrio pectenicida TaxID=62763 RepID=A0A427U5T2_9VIBR|nr:transporter substrate-binding domain-containing protein [Vibrio pectenicida]RSD31932.1 transporter substrate-binding domain-containing protein [Vibrio pectenicida]